MADVMYPLHRLLAPACGILAIAFSLMAAQVIAAKEKPKTSVADLRYGVALYHYYQQDYLLALGELMVADTRDGIQGHSDNPELIAGGISLSFGMQQHAEAVFTSILQDERRPESVRDAAWFYLGKLYYTRGDWAAAQTHFARVSENFKPALLAQMHTLQINIDIHNKKFSEYSLKKVNKKELRSWNPYALYNLGAAYAREGDVASAQNYFAELSQLNNAEDPLRRKEQWALQDKAFTAMGYTYIAEKKYSDAVKQFKQVRLDGMHSSQALLGYGWAAVAQQQYREAIKPWQMLRSRSLVHPAVQESLLALPFAYEKLGAQGEALVEYQKSETLLAQEIALIKDMRATLTEGELLTLIASEPVSAAEINARIAKQHEQPGALTAVVADDGQNWLKLDKTSIVKTRSAYLSELFSQNSFQSAVLDVRDLMRLQKMLRAWQPKLQIYQDLLVEKQTNRLRQERQFAQASVLQQEKDLVVQRDKLQAQIQSIVASEDVISLADEDTRELYALVVRAQAALGRLKAAGQDVSDQSTRLRMFGGILLWRAAQDYPARIATLQSDLQTLNKTLAEIAATKLRIGAITSTSIDIKPRLARLQQHAKMLEQELVKNEVLVQKQGALLRAQVDEQLALHEQRLSNYLAQTHLAVARLYDAELRKQPE